MTLVPPMMILPALRTSFSSQARSWLVAVLFVAYYAIIPLKIILGVN